MLTLITVILLALLIVAICKKCNDAAQALSVLFTLCLIVNALFAADVIGRSNIISEIEIYSEENQKIEDNIKTLLKYIDNDSDLENTNILVLVSLYPELGSDIWVEEQIELYIKNKSKIIGLKEDLISTSSSKWWLYFGR